MRDEGSSSFFASTVDFNLGRPFDMSTELLLPPAATRYILPLSNIAPRGDELVILLSPRASFTTILFFPTGSFSPFSV